MARAPTRKISLTEEEWLDVKVDIAKIKQDVSYIRKTLDGNGRNGLVTRVEALERGMAKVLAVASMGSAVVAIAVTIILHFV